MTEIRYVIVSDLHFGADNSLLTSLRESPKAGDTGFECDAGRPSPVLAAFLEGLGALSAGQARRPTLVLAGDILDLALSPEAVSATVFSGFARLAFGGGRQLFDPVVYYVPGNHDHHLWESAREAEYVERLASTPPGGRLGASLHVTGLCATESPRVTSAWMTGLARRETGKADVEVRVAYPNMVLGPLADRAVVVSHGHFTESIYTLMSQLKDALYPAQRAARIDDVAVWEQENFAWIDFLWSTLGRSGQVGTDLGLVYADLATPADLDALMANVARALLARGGGPDWLHGVEARLLEAVFHREVDRRARSERGTISTALTQRGEAGLRAYLEGPVRNQLERELGGVPADVSFVFGHTHKPFVRRWRFSGYPAPVEVVNTGGWVVDTAEPAPVQGAVAVLVDENLDLAPLQCYRQGIGATPTAVRLLAPDDCAPPSAFAGELAGRLQDRSGDWAELASEAAQLVAQRHRLQAAITASRAPAVRRG